MSSYAKRLADLEVIWKQPPRWRVWLAERTADGRLIEIGTGGPVQPGPDDVVITFHECEIPSGRVRPPGDAYEQL
ncbi:MAG: hypothetical protein M3Q71_15140 [Chloroflexota bacterium]|nr:hypothetical protein [Chloroflexota bacterium]